MLTVGDDDDASADPNYQEYDDDEDDEPNAKRYRSDFDAYDNDGSGSNDYDSRYGSGPGIPSLLNLNVEAPRHGHDSKNIPQKSPNGPWDNNHTNGAFGSIQNTNNKPQANRDRREGRRGSRWR